MDDDQKKEMYEVARRAVHDELRAIVFDIAAVLFGFYVMYAGLVIFLAAPLGSPLFSPKRIIGIGMGLLGLLLVAITWKWDQWLRRYLPIGSKPRS
jgi:uncharacterized membrane protein (DUF485 family)